MIKFRFNPRKAMQAVGWMLGAAGKPVDFHTILKAIYFADKQALNEHGRPIFGATYRAMNYGPVPLEVYEMLKCDPIWLSEMQEESYPWERQGYMVTASHEIGEMDNIALAERDILSAAFAKSSGMTFTERTRETHGLDWIEGTRRQDERMAYEDMIEESRQDRSELIEDLTAMGPRLVL